MSNKVFPTFFVSHGAPTLAIEPSDAHRFLRELGSKIVETFGKPKAILAISAHWETSTPAISAAEKPETIYDFGGFAPELYEIKYPAPGAPRLAEKVGELLKANNLSLQISESRGLDHGAWVPLKLIFPDADVPTTQFSVLPLESPATHYKIGQALSELRGEGILIIGLGSLTHNLRTISHATEPPAQMVEFDNWFYEKIMRGDVESLLNYEQLAPNAKYAHPTPEHLLPIFTAMGAGNFPMEKAQRLHQSWTYGSLSMTSYSFGNL